MKRVLLIAGGTVGGLGAVLSVTPPQLGDNGLAISGASAATSLSGSSSETSNSSAAVTTASPTATQSAAAAATKKATTKKTTSTATKSATSNSTASSSNSTSSSSTSNSSNNSSASSNSTSNSNSNTVTEVAPTPTPTKAAASGVSGSFTGSAIDVGYGLVQVKISVSNGKITDAVAVQAPSGRSQRFTDYSVPNLRSQTLSAQSAAIRGVSGASYTSYGWYKSLISALQKAGMATGV